MSVGDPVIRLAAMGDGLTEGGQHVPGGVPGDVVAPDGKVIIGPHRQKPVCRHFGICGGCQLQHVADPALEEFVRGRVAFAAQKQGFDPDRVLQPHLSPSGSRRRASLRFWRRGDGVLLGFNKAGSNQVIDISECPVLDPRLEKLLPALGKLVSGEGAAKSGSVELTVVDQGIDCAITGLVIEGYSATEDALDFARDNGLARLTVDDGTGSETMWEPEPLTITLGGVPVPFPSGAFLQATADGEAMLVGAARDWLQDCGPVADLFSGLGTFAFALAKGREIAAFEAAREPHLACQQAARRSKLAVTAHHRDLFRNPLRAEELAGFDAVILDPPRAGAKQQIEQIAQSDLSRVVYVSCNPMSWARDCAALKDAGFAMEQARPVGQFRWSTHVELASLFTR